MNYLQVLILAVVEAVTEFLPVSSTAHLILASKLLGVPTTDFLGTFEVVIQLGAILAVIVIFAQKLWKNKDLWPKIIWAFVPTAILGAVAYPLIKNYLLKGQLITGIVLILGGIVFLIWEKYWFKNDEKRLEIKKIDNKKIATVGLWQALSFIPGMSRSAVTILGGMMTGMKRAAAVEFSFMLAIPTMLAAAGYDLVKTLAASWQTQQVSQVGLASLGVGGGGQSTFLTSYEWWILITGTAMTFLVALLVIKWLMKVMSQKGSFVWFGIYRIILGIVWLIVFWP